MTVGELMAFLATQPADREVLVWAPDETGELCLCRIEKTDYDCFHPDGPWVVDIDLDRAKASTDRVADWLDGEGDIE